MKRFIIRFLAVTLLLSGIGVGAYALYKSSDAADKSLVFSDRTLLEGLWDDYKTTYWEAETGRTLDRQQDDITTSEGQSYTMLRAVWQSDKETFDKSWEWTQQYLRRDSDNLFSWRWGEKANGEYGVLTDEGGQNTASDADTDIALALVMAASRWQDEEYLDDARPIIRDIWDEDVIEVNGNPYLAANDLEKDSDQPAIINPSYFAPYAYRTFERIDPENEWSELVTSSYDLLDRSMDENLDKNMSVSIPPDWIEMDQQTGEINAIERADNLTTNYGFDAIRTPFRIALDYQWNDDPRAKATLEKMSFFNDEWEAKQQIKAVYAHDGSVVEDYESVENYATLLGYFSIVHPETATEIYDQKVKPLYDPNNNTWSQDMTYYGDNWTWFGIALYDNKLENLPAELKE